MLPNNVRRMTRTGRKEQPESQWKYIFTGEHTGESRCPCGYGGPEESQSKRDEKKIKRETQEKQEVDKKKWLLSEKVPAVIKTRMLIGRMLTCFTSGKGCFALCSLIWLKLRIVTVQRCTLWTVKRPNVCSGCSKNSWSNHNLFRLHYRFGTVEEKLNFLSSDLRQLRHHKASNIAYIGDWWVLNYEALTQWIIVLSATLTGVCHGSI